MTDQNLQGGSEPTGTIPAQALSPEDMLETFGITPEGTGNPPKSEEGQESGPKPPDTGNPPTGTTPEGGSAKDGEGQSPPAKKYAGKYDTPEALEAGYNNSFSEAQKLAEKIKDLEQQVQTLQAPGGNDPKSEPGTTPGKPAVSEAIQAAMETIKEVGGEDLASALDVVLQATTNQSGNDTEVLRQKVSRLESNEFREEFAKRYPESRDEKVMTMIDTIAVEAKEKAGDTMFESSLVLDAAKGRLLPELIDLGVLTKLKSMSAKDKELLLAGNVVAGVTAAGQAGGVSAGDQAREVQKSSFFEDRPDLMK